jgi:GNAT superfamily N-acetyltransferase
MGAVAQAGIDVADAGNEERVFDTVVTAFADDPMVRWTFPDEQQFRRSFPSLVKAFGGRAVAHGTAYYTDDYAGAALWLPPGVAPDEDAMIALVERSVEEERLPAVFSVFQEMGKYHPDQPHWYLPLIGVLPAARGKGYGSALLRQTLARCDEDGVPAYLEATSLKSVPFYERHGFALLGTIQVDSPPLYPMLRAGAQRK